MTSFYTYLIFYLLGFISAIVLVWYTKKPQNEIHIGKVKQKDGEGNTLDADLNLNVQPGNTRKEIRQERRADRKLKREAEKLKTVITNLKPTT